MGAQIWASGPEIDITLRDTVMSTAEMVVTGVVDTGASCVLMDQSLLFQLGLEPIDRRPIVVADGTSVPALGFQVQLKVGGLKFDQWFKVFGVKMKYPSTRVLLGRTFLTSFHVTYSGPDQWFHWYKAGPAQYEEHDG